MITTITGKNQVTIPATVASSAKLHPGTRLDWELAEGGEVLIARVLPDVATVASQLRGRGRKYRQKTGSAVGSLIKERGEIHFVSRMSRI